MTSAAIPVLVTADVDPSFLDSVGSDGRFELRCIPSRTSAEVAKAVGDARVIVSRAYVTLDADVFRAATALELIVQGTSGKDNIDLEEAARRNVEVVTTPGANANAVAELVLGLMLSLTRSIPDYDRSTKRGAWNRRDCADRHELRHHEVGVIGIGRVGTAVTRLASAFGCRIRAFDPFLMTDEIVRRGAIPVASLEKLLESSAILTLHVPLTPDTRGMIGRTEIDRMSEGSFLINTSRGEVVDAGAVLAAIDDGRLAGAALDVHDPEPPERSWPDDPRLILTPHIAGCTAEAKREAGVRMYRELCSFYGFEER